jgi:hypothetical protein
MPYAPSEIVNMALGHLGSQMTVVNFWTDQSNQAKTARTYWKLALGKMLADFPWPFATVEAQLSLVEWYYSRERHFAYAYPPNCVLIRRLYSWTGHNRNDDVQSRQKYKIIEAYNPKNTTQLVKLVLADHPGLWVEYTADLEKAANFPDTFSEALSFLMAFYMAPRLTGGDPYKMGDRALMAFKQSLATAEMLAGNEEVDDEPRLGQFIDERQGPWDRDRRQGGIEEWVALPGGTPMENE